jgi:Lipase (class 3)
MKRIKNHILLSTLTTGFILLTGEKSVLSETLENVCKAQNSSCGSIIYTSNMIAPTYELDQKKAADQMQDLGWDKSKTDFLDIQSFKAGGKDETVDSQAIISKQVVKGKTYYLFSFRGTEAMKNGKLGRDAITDADIGQRDFSGDAKVHSGFYTYTRGVFLDPKTQEMLQEILRNNSDYEVLVTGHSLGGAAAEVFSALLQKDSKIPLNRIKTITFGAPSPGNKEFTDKYLSNTIKAEIPLDIVPDSTKIVNDVIPSWLRGGEYNHDFGRRVILPASQSTTEKYQRLIDAATEREQLTVRLEKERENLKSERDKVSPIFSRQDRSKLDKKIDDLSERIKELESQKFESFKARLSLRVDAHSEYADQAKNVYDTALNATITPSWSLVGFMQNHLTSITQGGSTHIGSAAYYTGRPRDADSVDTSDSIRKQTFSGASNSSLQRKSEYTDGFILKPPVDVVLDWNQKVAQPLDLDSHLTGPAPALGQDTPVRFHVYWDEKGSLGSAPNVLLYRDTIPDTSINLDRAERSRLGPEQTRIGNPDPTQSGVYRFYVNNYSAIKNTSNGIAAGEYGLSNSGANVEVFNAGTSGISFDPNNPTYQGVGTSLGGKINIPTNGGPSFPSDPRLAGNVWYVFQLDQRTGILRRVDRFGTVDAPKNVPSIGEAPILPTLVR